MKPDRQTLDTEVENIMSAPKDGAAIEMLCNRPDFGVRNFTDRLNVTAAGGVENCRWSKEPWLKLEDGSGDPRIQISILQRPILYSTWFRYTLDEYSTLLDWHLFLWSSYRSTLNETNNCG